MNVIGPCLVYAVFGIVAWISLANVIQCHAERRWHFREDARAAGLLPRRSLFRLRPMSEGEVDREIRALET